MRWRFIAVPAGRKSHLQRLRHYLVAVTVGAGATQALQIYDLTNKLIGSTLQLPQVRVHRHTDSVGAVRRCGVGRCGDPEWPLPNRCAACAPASLHWVAVLYWLYC